MRSPTIFFLLFLPNVIIPSLVRADTIEAFAEPYRTVEISANESGVVSAINVTPGQTVRAGELLVSLDTSVQEAALAVAVEKANATGSLDAAVSELEFRTGRLQQIKLLRKRGHATEREFERAAADHKIAKARWTLAKEEAQLNKLDCARIRAQIKLRRVSSPCEGIISEVHHEIGEAVLISAPSLATLVQIDKLRVRFSLTPAQAAHVQLDQAVSVVLPDSDQQIAARIERISPLVDAKSGTLEVHVVIPNQDRQIRSGSRCLLELDAHHAAVHAPPRQQVAHR